MSIEQANAFRTFVNENEALQQQVMEGLQDGSLKLTALAKEHGFEVTAEEALGLLDQANPETDGELELTDFEMSLVNGGGLCLSLLGKSFMHVATLATLGQAGRFKEAGGDKTRGKRDVDVTAGMPGERSHASNARSASSLC